MSAFFFYTLFYVLMSGCVIYPPTEFVSAGLTIKDIFAYWLGSEGELFIQYHIKRSVITLLIHSTLPLGYILGLLFFNHVDATKLIYDYQNSLCLIPILCTVLGPLFILYKILKWYQSNWLLHPIAQCLAAYSNTNSTWESVASDINTEYRRVDKIIIDTNSMIRIIATDNWIIRVMPYNLNIAHQSDTALIVNRSDTHNMSPTTRNEIQFINIHVKPTRDGVKSFDLRMNALDFKNLQDRVSRPITILQEVIFHKTLLEQFIDTFKKQIAENPPYEVSQELEQCIGCMQVVSNVKLSKLCDNMESRHPEDCTTCYCRPMWCIDCMAKWFASRQDENAPETWLSSKCTCPVCRAKFCLLDVCLVKTTNSS